MSLYTSFHWQNPKQGIRFFLLLVGLLNFLSARAQSNYKPGYVVKLNGDTIRGYIDYREWDSTPKEILFKNALVNKSQRFTAHDINFFTISGQETYQRYIISISMNVVDIDKISSSKDSSSKIDTVFLKVIQKGKNIAFYSYSDQIKTRFYISEQPDFTPIELRYGIYNDVSANGFTKIDDTYKKQLFSFANKYNILDNSLIIDIQNADYGLDYLIPVITKINHISKVEYNSKYDAKSKVEFYIGAGVNLTNTSTSTSSPYYGAGGGGANIHQLNP